MRIFASNLNDRPHFIFSAAPHAEQPVYHDLDASLAIVRRCAIVSSALTFPNVRAEFVYPGERNAYIEHVQRGVRGEVLEEWRCYRTGEFRYRADFWELNDDDTQRRMRQKTIYPQGVGSEPLGLINIVAVAYRVIAAHIFAQRLFHAFGATVQEVRSTLTGIAGYALGRIDERQAFVHAPIARSNDAVFVSTPAEVQRAFDPYVISAEALVHLFYHFGWETTRARCKEWLDDVRELADRH